MKPPLSGDTIAAAYIAACRLEVRSLKPGNVHRHADGHGMKVRDFELSAEVSAPHISDPRLQVGARVHRAVDATFKAVGCNTNLGILLLCAPLAVAAGTAEPAGRTLQARVASVLKGLDTEDAREAFAAIARASPGGLGETAEHDVRAVPAPNLTLREAMQAAADRDLIAQQYETEFREVFALAARLTAAGRKQSAEEAVTRAYLHLLRRIPDTHISRKFGAAKAQEVCRRATAFYDTHQAVLAQSPFSTGAMVALLQFDKDLKVEGLNPGSLADLIAAAAFAASLQQAWPTGG